MITTQYLSVNFGASRTGLTTVGYQLFDTAGSAVGSRITANIRNHGDGSYGALVTLPDAFVGSIRWDDTTTGLKASEAVNPASGGSVAGSGSDSCTLNFKIDTTPIADADVWVTSDSAGHNVVAGTLQTDTEGNVTFMLDAGNTYYAWLQKDGVNSIRGQSFVAEAD